MKNSILVKIILMIFVAVLLSLSLISCEVVNGSKKDIQATIGLANSLQTNQPTPTDLEYSLERYNLIKRAYWVNGQREKANSLPCEIVKPLGYVVLFSGNAVVGSFTVDGKVSSLNSYLTPDSEYYEMNGSVNRTGDGDVTYKNSWLADVDGTYGENDSGIFFFTPDGKYIEWSGDYLYSDIPFIVNSPIVTINPVE